MELVHQHNCSVRLVLITYISIRCWASNCPHSAINDELIPLHFSANWLHSTSLPCDQTWFVHKQLFECQWNSLSSVHCPLPYIRSPRGKGKKSSKHVCEYCWPARHGSCNVRFLMRFLVLSMQCTKQIHVPSIWPCSGVLYKRKYTPCVRSQAIIIQFQHLLVDFCF